MQSRPLAPSSPNQHVQALVWIAPLFDRQACQKHTATPSCHVLRAMFGRCTVWQAPQLKGQRLYNDTVRAVLKKTVASPCMCRMRGSAHTALSQRRHARQPKRQFADRSQGEDRRKKMESNAWSKRPCDLILSDLAQLPAQPKQLPRTTARHAPAPSTHKYCKLYHTHAH